MPFLAIFWMIAAPVAIAVPVVIHLLNRRRFKIVTWAAMRFLLNAQRQNTRRMRLEQIILLLVRTAIIALVALAMLAILPWAEGFWGLFWPKSVTIGPKNSVRTHHVIVIDASLSMNQGTDDGTCFERARKLARAKIQDSSPGDGFSVLLLKQHPSWVVGEMSQDGKRVQKEMEDIYATHGNASVPAALNMISAKLSENAGRFPLQVVYFFTDMQKATWSINSDAPGHDTLSDNAAGTAMADVGRRARIVFVDVGKDNVSNVAVTDLSIDDPFIPTDTPIKIDFALHNFGSEARKGLRVELLKGRARETAEDPPLTMHVVDQRLLDNLSAGERKSLDFPHKFKEPGTYVLQVRIDSDVLPSDNVRTMIVTVKKTIPVLLVNGKASADRFDQATQFLQFALNPFPKGMEAKERPIRPVVVSAAQFSSMNDNELQGYDALFFCDVGQISPVEVRRLSLFLRLGGGIVFSTGDRVAEHLGDYNDLLYNKGQGLLPARLLQKETGQFSFWPSNIDYTLPPLKAFEGEKDQIALKLSAFNQYLNAELGADAQAQGVRTILSFQKEEAAKKPGDDVRFSKTHPALLEWQPPLPPVENPAGTPKKPGDRPAAALPLKYRGHVMLFTSTFNMDWNSWPASPSFLSMMQELSREAVAGKLRAHAYSVGSTLEDSFASGGVESDVFISGPDPNRLQIDISAPVKDQLKKARKVRTQAQGDVSLFRWSDTELSGIYLLTMDKDVRERPFAVNFPAGTSDQRGSESDLSRVDEGRLKEVYTGKGWEDLQVVDDPNKAVINPPAPVPGEEAVDLPGTGVGPQVARVLLLLVLALMFLEVVLAWRFGHHSAVDGVNAPPARGLAVPALVAAAALLLFAGLAFVLIHYEYQGDFMGFLPDGVRAWFEHLTGVPKAPPGEGTCWNLEYQSYLWDSFADPWIAGGLSFAAVLMLVFVYIADGPKVSVLYKVLLGGLRMFLILLTLVVLLPRLELHFNRQGWPDIVILLDDSRSMGESDAYVESEQVRDRAVTLAEEIKKELPARIAALDAEVKRKQDDPALKDEVDRLKGRLNMWTQQLNSTAPWTRLQLVQALLADPKRDWLNYIVNTRRSKVHIYHLDASGRAVKLSDITEADQQQIDKAHVDVAGLDAEWMESRLGTALRQVIDQYRGGALSAVVMFTDGNTTRDETIRDVSDYAAQKGVPLFFVGLGDDFEVRDLKLDNLQVVDESIVGDPVEFSAVISGQGSKEGEMKVAAILKVKEGGKEVEVDRKNVIIPANNNKKTIAFKLLDTPKEIGRKQYIVELEVPKTEKTDLKPENRGNLRLERYVDIVDNKKIKVLLVDGQARYDFRFLKTLLEREIPDEKKNKSIELNVVLLDADDGFAGQDRSALSDFPSTREDLSKYDVVIFGDVDPKHKKMGEQRLKNLAEYVRGSDAKGGRRSGGGILFVAGAGFNPQSFKGTPLADVLPVVPLEKTPFEAADQEHTERLRLEWTQALGQRHPIYRLAAGDAENAALWKDKFPPIYWWATNYKIQAAAEVLAVHPKLKAESPRKGQDPHHPLIVQQFVGSGRSMFFGFDESWRWRYRENEVYYNKFWIQTIRYLARGRQTRTQLRLEPQKNPYRLGEAIKVRVDFPDNISLPGQEDPTRPGPAPQVKVEMAFTPDTKDARTGPETVRTLTLTRLDNRTSFEGVVPQPHVGKYKFWLSSPDVSKLQPGNEKPSAEARVELPPGELDKIRLNSKELAESADATGGRFYTLATADQLLDQLPYGSPTSLSSPHAPINIWNNPLTFVLLLVLLTAEWLLRKRKHLV